MTSIEWTRGDDGSMGKTWNPVRGCSRVSSGCDSCYAMGQAHRFSGPGGKYEDLTTIRRGKVDWTGTARLVPDQLEKPLRWKKPRRVFVNSMCDLFHESLSNEEIAAVFGVMASCPQHSFQVLTKRPKRMAEWFEWLHHAAVDHGYASLAYCTRCAWERGASAGVTEAIRQRILDEEWPLPNVWLGVSAENQATADERIPWLLSCPAAVRFVSAEPLLSDVDLGLQSATCDCCDRWPSRWVRLERRVRGDWMHANRFAVPGVYRASGNRHGALCVPDQNGEQLGIRPDEFECLPALDWVICGGESGLKARPFDLAWARSLRDQCTKADVAFFMKQAGSNVVDSDRECGVFAPDDKRSIAAAKALGREDNPPNLVLLRHRKGGDLSELKGNWPREFPA